jgi:hypothetical protein
MARTKPIPYSEDVRPEDTARALETVNATLFPNETKPWAIDFKGTCPRCGDAIEIRQWIVVVAGALRMDDSQMEALSAELDKLGVDRSSGDETFDLICSCSANHPHHPADTSGCGARFRVRVGWP